MRSREDGQATNIKRLSQGAGIVGGVRAIPDFRLWIITANRQLRSGWDACLSSEGWPVIFLDRLDQLAAGSASVRTGFALIDVEVLCDGSLRRLQDLREGNFFYILFGLKGRCSDAEIIRHLEAGADDYLEAPIEGSLLAAKLKAHLRRILPELSPEMAVLFSPKNGFKCDQRKMRAWSRESGHAWKDVPNLTATEFRLLCLFLLNPEAALDRRFILEAVWQGKETEVNAETVDKHIECLRRKLGAAGKKIQTLYGVGYALREE